MIRAALITIAFLGVTLALILSQPTSQPSVVVELPQPAPEGTVSRAETNLDALNTLAQSLDVSSVTAASPMPEPEAPAVLPVPEPAPGSVSRTELSPTPQVAASVATLPSIAPRPQSEPANELERLIINALAQGQSEGYIDALVNHAAREGELEVPASLVTADGRVDTGSLLAVLSRPPKPDFGPGRNYVVQPGDSLASIAYRFYGTTGKAADIFMANRAILASPNEVEAGQTLALPEL